MYTDDYLTTNGAAPFSKIIMTENAFLTDEAWLQIVPSLIKGLRLKVKEAAFKFGIDKATASKLTIGLTFDGFKSHVKNLRELVMFAENNIMCAVEGRDSSEINQVIINCM